MFLEQGMAMMEKIASALKNSEPEKRDHFLKSALILFDVALEALKNSPEFREAFAKVHMEFLNYPEYANQVISKSIKAYEEYKNNK